MVKGPFSPDQFTATQFNSAEVKAAFGNHFLRFVRSGFERSLFTKAFYNRLSMCFSHIAHCNLSSFYETWFADDEARLRFLLHTLRFPCYGDPKFTYSDVEREIQCAIHRTTLITEYQLRVETATRSRELAQLERLQAKYGGDSIASSPVATIAVPAEPASRVGIAELDRPHLTFQPTLF